MPEAVRALVRYLNPEWKERSDVPAIGDRESRRRNTSKFEVSVRDVRGRALDLDEAGFALLPHASAVADFHDDREVERVYYPEVVELLERVTGADRVVLTQHVVRTEDTSDFNTAYARFVHCDYSLKEPRQQARRVLDDFGVVLDEEHGWDFAWYNTWQPIERPVLMNPLAMIDARSLGEGDVCEYEYAGFGSPVRSAMPVYNPDHEFFYFSEMQPGEMLLLKQLDTRPGRAVSCPHTSFDLKAREGALGRRSIEVRAMCAFASG